MDGVARRCALCSGNAALRTRGFPGFREPGVFDLYQCDACHAVFCDPLQGDAEIYDQIYAQSAAMPGYERYVRYLRNASRKRAPLRYLAESEDVYWGVERLLAGLGARASGLRVLDVGCGLGYLTYALRSAGYQAVGIDVSEQAVTGARREFGGDYRKATLQELAARGERFHAVVMAETIEHVADPAEMIRAGVAVLVEGGRLIVTTPNRSAFGPHVVWSGDLPPIHLWWLSEESLRAIAQAVACDIEFVDYSAFNDAHLAPMVGPWCRPHVGQPGLDRHGDSRGSTIEGHATQRILQGALDIANSVGLEMLARRFYNELMRHTSMRWAKGPRRMTMAASLTRHRGPS